MTCWNFVNPYRPIVHLHTFLIRCNRHIFTPLFDSHVNTFASLRTGASVEDHSRGVMKSEKNFLKRSDRGHGRRRQKKSKRRRLLISLLMSLLKSSVQCWAAMESLINAIHYGWQLEKDLKIQLKWKFSRTLFDQYSFRLLLNIAFGHTY